MFSVYSLLSPLRKNLKQVFQGHWPIGFQNAMDFCGFHSGKSFNQTGTATATNYNFLNMFKNKSFLF